jgi:hypothetical protein
MPSEDKVQLKSYISRSLNERFRMLIMQKHGRFVRGLLSYELETALTQYIASYQSIGTEKKNSEPVHTHAHTQETILQTPEIHRANPTPKVYQLKEDIKCYLATHAYEGSEPPQFIPEGHLKTAIHELIGVDKRTYDKYLDLLIEYGCIKRSGAHQFEWT